MIKDGIEAISALAQQASRVVLHKTPRDGMVITESGGHLERMEVPRATRELRTDSLECFASAVVALAKCLGDVRVTVGTNSLCALPVDLHLSRALDLPTHVAEQVVMVLSRTAAWEWLSARRTVFEAMAQSHLPTNGEVVVKQTRMALIARTLLADSLPPDVIMKIENVRVAKKEDMQRGSARARESLGVSVVSQVEEPDKMPDPLVWAGVRLYQELNEEARVACHIEYDLSADGWLFTPAQDVAAIELRCARATLIDLIRLVADHCLDGSNFRMRFPDGLSESGVREPVDVDDKTPVIEFYLGNG